MKIQNVERKDLVVVTNNEIKRFTEVSNKQQAKGLENYKTSLEDANLSVQELIEHAEEEIVDNWNYLQEIRRKLNLK